MISKPGLITIGALAAVVLGATSFYLRGGSPQSDALVLYGNIDIRQVELSFHDPERVEQILVQEGERVKRGQLLATQAPERFQYARDQASAKVDVQQHQLDKLLHGSRPQEIGKAGNDVKAAEAAVVLAKKELARLQVLVKRKLSSAESLDRAQAQYDGAKESLQALRQQYALTEIGPRREDIQVAQAQLKADQAALQLAEKVLADARLYAPQDGVVQNRILEPGDMGNAQKPVLTLALRDPLWARTYVAEADLGRLRYGLSASLASDSFPDKNYRGWVAYMSPTAEFTPKTVETTELRTSLVYQVRIYACDPDDQLRLGMPVTVTIDTHQAPMTQPSCEPAP
ncbi:HlyD family efflux transporter periplasmic adaptor subunit [Methylomonas albis]|uniref:HlyD family efflux transporter periplasmic adaptor subunit n=1 Tax=Methylomonas albis TaxID=1854563 RepID=A0ABR9D4T4_9GAMM|nr:HlyD family efflux transporter periplasmic adaptor subunit [Methylomonas albis]MBD9357940.1 HlyD family efflux transporter periplasmic adaptor subunit [Methylomonas albis]